VKALLGIAIVVANLAAFAAVEQHSEGTELAVDLRAGTVPAAIANRVHVAKESAGPGLRRTRWSIEYRGGHARQVGATTLVGPVQQAGACSGRVVVGQKLLDALAPITATLVKRELAHTEVFGLGDFQGVDDTTLRWASGGVRATATVRFERASVPLTIVLVPVRDGATLRFRVSVHGELRFANRVIEWLSEKLPTDELVSQLASQELDAALVTTFAPPPPVELGDGQELRFTYCDGPIEIADGAFGALPFAVAFDGTPVHFDAGPRVPPRADTTLALDLDVDALNAMLAELWRTRWLDRRLAEAGLDKRFAEDATVAQYLSVRVGAPTLALPPVLEPAGDHLRLAADARIAIRDGDATTTGRVFGALELRFPASIKTAPLELACERTPTMLVPCYADLVAGLAARSGDFDGALARQFAELVRRIFAGQKLAVGDVPIAIGVRGADLALAPGARGVHVELDAELLQ
jgi:hypothetical protein